MAATLDDVKKELIANRKVTDDILKTNSELVSQMTEYFKDLKEQARQALLDKKESDREAKKAMSMTSKGGSGGRGGRDIFAIPSLSGLLKYIGAGLAALSLALAGLRGWELKALKNIKTLGTTLKGLFAIKVIDSINQRFINARARILRNFGLDPTLGKKDPDTGKRTLKVSVLDQIRERFRNVRVGILRTFGLGVDGKPIVVQGSDGKFKVPTIARITTALGSLFAPVTGFLKGVTDFFKKPVGVVANVFRVLGNLGVKGLLTVGGKVTGFLGAVGGLIGKFLWPLGLLVSMYDGVMAFINEKGTPIQKTIAGLTATVASFIGAPLDLIKNIAMKIAKALFLDTDENGNIIVTGMGSAVASFIDKFSFQDSIKAIPRLISNIIQSVLEFLKDPIGIGKSILGDLVEGIKTLFFAAMRTILYSIDIPGAKKIADTYFMTDEQRLAEINKQQKQLQSELSNLSNNDELAVASLAELRNIPIEEARKILSPGIGGELFKDLNSKDVIAQQNLIFEQLQKLSQERTDLMQEILVGQKPASVVNAPTNNINNVSQGINYPFGFAITNGLVFR